MAFGGQSRPNGIGIEKNLLRWNQNFNKSIGSSAYQSHAAVLMVVGQIESFTVEN